MTTWRERFMRGEASVSDIAMIESDGEPIIKCLGLSLAEFMVYCSDLPLFEKAMTWEREERR